MSDEQTANENRLRETLARRTLLRLTGAGAALSTAGLVAAQDDDNDDGGDVDDDTAETNDDGGTDDDSDDVDDDDDGDDDVNFDPVFGYPGLADDEVPDDLDPDHVVDMETRPPVEEALGDFVFNPVGLHVEPGDVVEFRGTQPEHTATAYHNAQGRWQLVPDDVPPLTSPVVPGEGFWLYRFDEPGVYDLFCAPHELFGMAMRVVVGTEDEWTVVRNREGRPPLEASQFVLNRPALDPAAVVEAGTVAWDDLELEPPSAPTEGGSAEDPATEDSPTETG